MGVLPSKHCEAQRSQTSETQSERIQHKRRPGLRRPPAFLFMDSPLTAVVKALSARQEGCRQKEAICVCACVQREGHNVGAPNTRGSTQQNQRAPEPANWDTAVTWTGLATNTD